MQDLHLVIPSWSHIVECTTISRNEVLLKSSEAIYWYLLYQHTHFTTDPRTPMNFSIYIMPQLAMSLSESLALLNVASGCWLLHPGSDGPFIHNFIWIHDDDDIPPPNIFHGQGHCQTTSDNDKIFMPASEVTRAETARAAAFRDSIAKEMWRDYQDYHGQINEWKQMY